MFKTVDFLTDFNIPFTDTDSIVSSKYVGLNCNFCNDHKRPYLGFNKETGYIKCWRCGAHSLQDFIEIYTGITDKSQIYSIIKKYKGESVGTFYTEKSDVVRPTKIVIPGKPELIPSARKYLIKRSFDPEYVFEKFKCHSTTYDKPSYRIIFPFMYLGRSVSWTGRDYTGKSDLRYISAKEDTEIVNHKSILYNWDNQKKGGNVLLVEGILDAVRTNGLATAGTSVTMAQLALLKNFNKVFIMFDGSETAIQKAHEISIILTTIGVDNEVLELDEGEDPDTAFIDPEELIYLKKELGV